MFLQTDTLSSLVSGTCVEIISPGSGFGIVVVVLDTPSAVGDSVDVSSGTGVTIEDEQGDDTLIVDVPETDVALESSQGVDVVAVS